MTDTINSRRAREMWSDLLDRARRGERLTITINGIPVAGLVPAADLEDLEHMTTPADSTQHSAPSTQHPPDAARDDIEALALVYADGDRVAAARLLAEAAARLLAPNP